MKKRYFLIGLIFALATLTSRAQILELYHQDFETGSTVNYSVSSATGAATQNSIYSGGSRAMKMTHTQSNQVILTLDTIDFSFNATLNYFTLEFQHIAFVDPLKCNPRTEVCVIEVKRPDQTNWVRLNASNYNQTESGSPDFVTLGSFSVQTYNDWRSASGANNTLWKPERFDLDQIFMGVLTTDRKLQIRFILAPRISATSTDAWYIDDIKVRASSMQIVTPRITMRSFPDVMDYPSSRGGKIVCDVSTTVLQGINGDSVFCVYAVGNRNTYDTAYLHRVPGSTRRFEGRIPFYGYDTIIRYHVVVKDSTVNNNTAFFPKNSSQFKRFRCVRGRDCAMTGFPGPNTVSIIFPFPWYIDNRSEFVYDSITMSQMGVGPGAITDFRFQFGSSPRNITRPNMQIRMANAPGSYTRTNTNTTYTTTDMQIVYDGSFLLEQAAANSYKTVTLQDTFFYAGGDIIVQIFYDGTGPNDLSSPTSMVHVPSATGKPSLCMDGMTAGYGFDAFGSDLNQFAIGTIANTRPWISFNEYKNVPLVHDCGISSLAYPSYDIPSNVGSDSVVVWLKNFGALPFDSCGVYYQIDGGTVVGPISWTGHLFGGDSVRVVLSTNQNFTVGYHTMRAWVGDYIKTYNSTLVVRDHEPYNDTTFRPFASCDGPYSGTRTVGTGSGAHFSTLEKCLYALSRCGIDAPLTIKLPAGTYDVTEFPFIPGTSAANYVTFEPATPTAVVTFRRARRGVNTPANALVDLSQARSIRFKNIRFSNGTNADNRCTNLALLGRGSSNCQFLNCTFVDSNTVTASAQALINSGYADSMLVKNCSFYGGTNGIDCNGPASDNRSSDNTIQFNDFTKQVNSAIRVVNQNHVLVDSNFCNDVLTNASYVILAQYCYDGSRIVRNRVFNSKGACCIGVSDYHGTSTNYSIVANNMVVSLDDGSTNMLTTPLNIIKGSYIKAVFNSVRMSAPSRVNVAGATFGGDIITNSYFQNNVIATFDSSNYAFSFVPGDNAASLHVDHNCYYSISGVLNKLTGVNYTNLNNWTNAVPGDVGSVVGNPNYTNGSICRVDLRSFNALLRNVGTPIPEVTNDLFGSTRNATAPSLGAYEVTALSVDFTPVEFVTPLEDYCGAPSAIPVEVAIRNTGSGTYTYTSSTPITIYYNIDNGPTQSFSITNRTCGPGDTIHFLSTRTMSLPSGANMTDRTYNIRWMVKCSADPDDLNDTAYWTVISRYAAPAPTVINQNVAYGNSATITPTAGVNTWPVSYYTSGNGRQQRSGISWYHNADGSEPFYYGPSYTTEPVFADTTFYISQKRNLPLVKITEVQVNRTAAGATNPMPSWMNSSTAFAIELTNCGDYPANLEGDSIIVVQPTAAAKIWVLPNVTIQPGANLVLQYKTSTTPSDSSRTIFAPSTAIVAPAYTANFGIIYRDGNGVADAVAFNTVITASSTQAIRWGNQNIPAAVWQGSSIDLAKNGNATNTPTAGARRIAWPTNAANASPTATATLWQVATAENPMHIGETETNLIRYTDNGCEGALSAVNLHVTGVPSVDLCISSMSVDTGCNLSTSEPVSIRVQNYGSTAVSNVVVKYSTDGGVTVAGVDTIPSIGIRSAVSHVFTQHLNMHANSDTTYCIRAWVEANVSDISHLNDTLDSCFFSAFTPATPIVPATVSVNYGEQATITPAGVPSNAYVIWSNAQHVDVATTPGPYQTPIVYHRDTLYYRSVALKDVATTHVGTLASIANNNFPSPYNPKTRYVKEQYIVPASVLRQAGHDAGTISSLSFYLEALGNNVTTFTYSYYNIKMGTAANEIFSNTTYLTGLTPVYSATNLTFTADNLGWVKHNLDTPYIWDGTSNIVIEVTRALSTAGISAGANTRYTAAPNTVLTKQHASNDMANETTAGNKGGNRPDMLFGFLEPVGCESVPAENAPVVYIDVDNVPDVDATIAFDPVHDTVALASCDTSTINVVLTNMGGDDIDAYTFRYRIDNGAWQQTSGSANNLPLGYSRTLPLLSTHLTPGRHSITGVVLVPGDTITSNDTISRTFNVRFCGGTYLIGSCSGSDYPTLTAAVDTLMNAGVQGNVTFDLCPQNYNEQIILGHVAGADRNNKVTFRTRPGSAQMAKITRTPSNSSTNYVIDLNAANYVTFDSIYFYSHYTTGSGNNIYANVASVTGSNNVAFRNCVFRSMKTTASSTNANIMFLGSENHYITLDHCVLDSGYYSIRSLNNVSSDNINITNCDITNFWFQGIYLRNTDTITITDDSIAAGCLVAGKPLTGIYLANIRHANVQRNFILLMDNATGGKRGIVANNCRGTNLDRVAIYNNMISLKGTAVASLSSSGIWVDSLSKYVNVYYNSARLYAGANQAATRTFSVQNSSSIFVMNNIFDNESKGYAAYIAIDTCVSTFNYNNFWSNCEPNANTGARKFVKFGTPDYPNLDSLRLGTNTNINSFELDPLFNSERDLRLRIGILADRAQYNPDVTTDVFRNIRPQIPQPTIGCYEFNSIRMVHDVAVATVVDPYVPAVTTGSNAQVNNIETDPITVRATFFNNGTSNIEAGCTWYAYIADVSPAVISETRTLPALGHNATVLDSVTLDSPLGVVDTQRIVVVINIGPGVTDAHPENNVDTAEAFIYPAYNLQLMSAVLDSSVDARHCRMYDPAIRYTLKNVGFKDFPGDFNFELGYDYFVQNPSGVSFPNMPAFHNGGPYNFGAVLPVGITREIIINPADRPDLYPYNYPDDVTIRFRGWVNYEHDVKPANDTTNYINIVSNHTPNTPIVHDTAVDYGSYGNLYATQTDGATNNKHFVLHWTRDSINVSDFYNGGNNYNRSTHWSSTPQYFHDSVYYVYCVSDKGCTSYYQPIFVSINPALSNDVSISKVLSPRASGRVYQERDTVKLRVVNYGSQPVTNIPIAFKWMNANGRTTYLEVHDTVRATIPGRTGDDENNPNQVHHFDYVFDTALLNVNNPLPSNETSYTLNAWVYHPTDQQRGNDTLRAVHTFKALPENTYNTVVSSPVAEMEPTEVFGFDITRVSFNELDNIMPDLIGYDHLYLGSYQAASAEVPTLVMGKGTTDTLTIEVANNTDEQDHSTKAALFVAIDYNRDGQYDTASVENLTYSRVGNNVNYTVPVTSRTEYKLPLTIPDAAQYGYMRMMVFVSGDTTMGRGGNFDASLDFSDAQKQEYLLYISEDKFLDSVDAALTRVVTPRDHIIPAADTVQAVKIMLANKGRTDITAADIDYTFADLIHVAQSGTVHWTGFLEPGHSTVVELDSIPFYRGTTNLTCTVNVPGDTFHVANNTLQYQYHRYYSVELRFIDSFDQLTDKWYVPAGYNNYTRNYWERTTPNKSVITSAYSQPNAYVTSGQQTIVTGKHGNRSVLYTPMINIRRIRPDTITFNLSKNLLNESFLYMEYYNYERKWVKVEHPGARWDNEDNPSWYDSELGWTGSEGNGAYTSLSFPTSLISGDFDQDVQFRFVYRTPVATSANAGFGDGAAIDNFRFGRARRSCDVGVTAITHPTSPQFGQTIHPRVIIHNFGNDSLRDFIVAYRPYGVYLAAEQICHEVVAPGEDIEYEFPNPFTITNIYPDTFQICAYTRVPADIYTDNDTSCAIFGLAPLVNDLYMYEIVSPMASAVAGDSVEVTVRLRNFGQNEIDSCSVTFAYNNDAPVTEYINFSDYLGRPLGSTEFFNYTFHRRVRATIGTMRISTWCSYDQDTYPYNDTLQRTVAGIASIIDLRATNGIVDAGVQNEKGIEIVIDNVGARMANNFRVGYWYDNDTSTRFEETFYREGGIPAGGRAVHKFSRVITDRGEVPIVYLTCYVAVNGDTNQRNDTTTIISDYYHDLSLDYVEVEETRADRCRVRFTVTNRGTNVYYNFIKPEARINGETADGDYPRFSVYINPGETRHLMAVKNGNTKTIARDPNRSYIGMGQLKSMQQCSDNNQVNDQTTDIRVVNYFEDIPHVNENDFVLEQNFPNPVIDQTKIEFSLPYAGSARFFVTDVVGRPVYERTATYSDGRHSFIFSRDELPAGVYYYGVEFDGERRMHKMIIK